VEIAVSTTVHRPLATVWDFYAVHHVENHPRWDPDLELEQLSEGPIGLGTRIKRRNTRYETPTEGTMEVVEFEPQKALGVAIQDGPIETRGRASMVAVYLSGEGEIEASDGEVRRILPGMVLLAEDTAGRGHRVRAVGDEPVTVVHIVLPD
jgi:hypothetical protein